MEFLKDLKEEIQIGPPLEVGNRTIHVIARLYTFKNSKCIFSWLKPVCLAVEDCKRYIIPFEGELSNIETEYVWKLVENSED